jgi:hypothetical protein
MIDINQDKIPDPRWHFRISMLKSLIRIGAGTCMMFGYDNVLIGIAGGLLVIAEMLGIAEELV